MSEWETFCDLCYYHLWRVRRKNERGFNDGYHIHNGEEARSLVELLNGLERERDEALAYADKLAAGLPEGMLPKDVEVLRDANLALAVERDALQEQLDAAIMLGKMQERRHERELEQVRLASAAQRMLGQCRQSPTTDQ